MPMAPFFKHNSESYGSSQHVLWGSSPISGWEGSKASCDLRGARVAQGALCSQCAGHGADWLVALGPADAMPGKASCVIKKQFLLSPLLGVAMPALPTGCSGVVALDPPGCWNPGCPSSQEDVCFIQAWDRKGNGHSLIASPSYLKHTPPSSSPAQ